MISINNLYPFRNLIACSSLIQTALSLHCWFRNRTGSACSLPQETGNKEDVEWISLTASNGQGLLFVAPNKMAASALN